MVPPRLARCPDFYGFFFFTLKGVLLPTYQYCSGQFLEKLILPNVLRELPQGIGAPSLPTQMVRYACETLNC